MVRPAIDFSPANLLGRDAAQPENYLAMLHGEFPHCLDDSETSETPSDLIGSFDLVLAEPPQAARSHGRVRTPLDRFQPDTGWLSYAELYLREGGSLLIFSALESIGAYAAAINAAGLNYQATFLSETVKLTGDSQVVAIIWASKESPCCQPFMHASRIINCATAGSSQNQQQVLIETLLAAFTEPGMMILQPFMSSSEVLAACQKMHRFCLAVARKRSYIKQAEQTLLGELKRTA